MSRRVSQTDMEKVFSMIRAAATLGRPCPTTIEIANHLGLASLTAHRMVKRLEAAGRLRVESGGNWRIVTILATGERTLRSCPAEGHERRKTGETGQRLQRPCLRCGSTFHSEGAHNRLCSPCRDFAAASAYA